MHKFKIGQRVQVVANSRTLAPSPTGYEVIRQLPESEGELSYRVKSRSEAHERSVKESELRHF